MRTVSKRTGRVSYVARFSMDDGARRQHRSKSFAVRQGEAEKLAKARAEQWLTARLAEFHRGDYLEPSREPFGALVDRYLRLKRPEWASSTYVLRDRIWHNHGRDELGAIQLRHLTQVAIQARYLAMLDAGKSTATVKVLHELIHQALAYAVVTGLIARNPADHARVTGPPSATVTVWTPAHGRRFWAGAHEHHLEALWLLLLSTGMRIGEALALRWEDVDRERGAVAITRTLRTGYDGRPTIADTAKTAGSRRTVPLIPSVADALTRHQQRQREIRDVTAVWHDQGLIFCGTTGDLIRGQSVNSMLGRLCRRLDVPTLSPHKLRHTGATVLIAAGIPMAIVAELLGHDSIQTTVNLYGHISLEMTREAAELLGKLFGDDPANNDSGTTTTPSNEG